MNETRWDAIADAYARGDLLPANGKAKWRHLAWMDVQTIALVLHARGVLTLLEVGSGVGRLTPFLARHFRFVVATDTSTRCREVTIAACAGLKNVSVCHPDDATAPCDAALVWGNLYDEDWTTPVALEHALQLLGAHGYLLVQTARPDLRERLGPALLTGADWLLIR